MSAECTHVEVDTGGGVKRARASGRTAVGWTLSFCLAMVTGIRQVRLRLVCKLLYTLSHFEIP